MCIITVCIIKSFLCHNIKQAMSYHIMKFYVTTYTVTTIAASLMDITIMLTLKLGYNIGTIIWVVVTSSPVYLKQRPKHPIDV